ncbi:nucleoside hydrolase [Xylona heveae TC161]|uniref:Nucleoside hydrolase n=1 Tax=Xylona heveae (strain CBS 132557 / TC161) TaxID=1328760 RepID=A0A164ZY66_XYLHT|nr:nucleoside hydrolase [Xylona heveae TC161]KZF19689.1 nucleoside hydrolase [Xylona heveae TC161]
MVKIHSASVLFTSAIAALASASPVADVKRDVAAPTNKVVMDNDYAARAWNSFLLALNAGWDVLGLTASTGDTWMPQGVEHALANLELGGLSCIPVYAGSVYPLLNTPELFQTWQKIHGAVVWQGSFAPENATLEAEGMDPTSGDPFRINTKALVMQPTTMVQNRTGAVNFMIEQVYKYPGQVSIYAAGALTNVALAVRSDPKFASLAKELVIMGGYIDVNMLAATGSPYVTDLNTDINTMYDPEASKIALTADFPNITIAGNVANSIIPTDEWFDELVKVESPYTKYIKENGPGMIFPFWDDIAGAILVEPAIVTNSTKVYIDVDTAWSSPSYGTVRAYAKDLAPMGTREVNYVNKINETRFYEILTHSLQYPKTCADLS